MSEHRRRRGHHGHKARGDRFTSDADIDLNSAEVTLKSGPKLLKAAIDNHVDFLIEVSNRYVTEYIEGYSFPRKLRDHMHGDSYLQVAEIFYSHFEASAHPNSLIHSIANRSWKAIGGKELVVALEEAYCSRFPAVAEYKDRFPTQFDSRFYNYLLSHAEEVETGTRFLFLDALRRNAVFRITEHTILAEDRKTLSMITDKIPDNMPDLFPLARQMKRHFILHVGPTNSGKTHSALEALKQAEHGIYLAPLRLLAYEIYDRLNQAEVPCNMITGEEEIIVPGAQHVSATIETLSTMEIYDVAVIDECQMIADETRGGAWSKALLGVCADEVHICSDPSCVDLIKAMIEECNDTWEIHYSKRMTPLKVDDSEDFIFPQSVQDKDALIVFSKQSVIAVTAELQKNGIKASMIYGNLPYDVRMSEVHRFVEGETSVVVATDAIGMGLNLPIRRIVFLEMSKFDGYKKRFLNDSEIKQIAGRAGRKGIYDIGYCTSEYRASVLKRAIEAPFKPIEKAKMPLPESIIYIDKPLSEILQRWQDIDLPDMYDKTDLSEDLALCKRLEEVVIDKKLLYDFITLGFKTGKPFLIDMAALFAAAEQEGGDRLEDKIDDIIYSNTATQPEDLEGLDMEALESEYLRYDLTYAYLRKFKHRRRMDGIIALKRVCSAKIIDILKTQKLEPRKCVDCGLELSWNYPYTRCGLCYKKKEEERSRGFKRRRH